MPKRLKKKTTFKTFSGLAFSLPKNFLILMTAFLHFALLKQNCKRGRPKKRRLSKKTKVVLIASAFTVFIFSYTVVLLTAAYQLPSPARLTSFGEPLTTEFYDRSNILLYRLYEGKNRTLTKLSEVSPSLIQATIAIEDRNFYRHPGINLLAIIRAFYHNRQTNSKEGASTITQQLIKNSLLTPEKSYARKIKEALLALWAERIYSKEEILQMYFNETPYGGSIVGIAAAASSYFDKSPSQLNLAESAFLAGLPASPTQFSPYGPQGNLGKLRQKEVLNQMVKAKYISPQKAEEAYRKQLNIRPQANSIHAPHFVFYIRDLLAAKYGVRTVTQGGLKIYTTLDLSIQQNVEKIVADEINKLQSLNVQNGAAMVLDAENSQILAMVGSRDYHYPGFGNFNVALALRQPGSSIKPLTYAVAFEKGFNPGNIILDTPVNFTDEWGNSYSPVNYDGRYHGPITLRQALGSSLNIPAVKLLAIIEIEPVASLGKNLGLSTLNNPKRFGLSLTLGSAEVKMIEMMGVYKAFARNGKFQNPTGILKVVDSKNNLLEEYKNYSEEIINPQIAYLIANILSDDKARQIAFGANSLLNIPNHPVAVKTGTSDNKRDNWAFGFTPKYVVGVWVGNPDNSPMNPYLTSGITGAAPIWNKIMSSLLAGSQPLAFEKPANLSETFIDGNKDLSNNRTLPRSLVRIQKQEDKYLFFDPFSSYSTPSAQAASKKETIN